MLARGRAKCQSVGQSALESWTKDLQSKYHKQQHHKLTAGYAWLHEDLEFWHWGQKYSDDRNSIIICIQVQNSKFVRIHGFEGFWFGDVGVLRVILDLVKDESKIIDAKFCARLQKDVDCINWGMIIGTQHTSTPAPWSLEQKAFLTMDLKSWSLTKWLKCIFALVKSSWRFFNSKADMDLLNRCPSTKDARLKNWHSGCPFLTGGPTALSWAC